MNSLPITFVYANRQLYVFPPSSLFCISKDDSLFSTVGLLRFGVLPATCTKLKSLSIFVKENAVYKKGNIFFQLFW